MLGVSAQKNIRIFSLTPKFILPENVHVYLLIFNTSIDWANNLKKVEAKSFLSIGKCYSDLYTLRNSFKLLFSVNNFR